MPKKDLRTIGWEERSALRKRAIEVFQANGNVLKTAKKLGINRQVLHSWIKNYKKSGDIEEMRRGPISRRLYKAQENQLLDALDNNLPQVLDINGFFWSASSFSQLVQAKFGIALSIHMARRLLKGWGFPIRVRGGICERSSYDTDRIPLYKYAKSQNMQCYCLRRIDTKGLAVVRSFYCITSNRGDLRFVGSKSLSEDSINILINKLYQVTKKRIIVASEVNISPSDLLEISIPVKLFAIKGWDLRVIHG